MMNDQKEVSGIEILTRQLIDKRGKEKRIQERMGERRKKKMGDREKNERRKKG